MAKVSVIVPIYNVEKYIKRTVDSLINQSFKDIEIVLINDGSTDNSVDIINSYCDDRIKIYSQSNQGGSVARNLGIEKSTSDFLMFLDADDYYYPDCIEKAYNKIINDNVDICIYGSKFVDDDGNNIKSVVPKSGIIDDLRNNKSILLNIENCTWDKIYKSEIIKKNGIKYPVGLYYQDFGFTFSLLRYVNSISFIEDELIEYTVGRSGNVTNDISNKVFDIFEVIDGIKELYIESGLYEFYFEELKAIFIINIVDKLKQVVLSNSKDIRDDYIEKCYDYIYKEFGDFHSKYKISKHKYDFIYFNKYLLRLYMKIKEMQCR